MSDKLTKLPEGKEHYVKVSKIAKELGCDIRHVYYAIRKEYVSAVTLTNSKYVDPDETREWYNNRSGKRGRKPTRNAESLDDKFGVRSGVILHTVVEVQRRVQVVEDIKETENNTTVVKVSNADKRHDKFKGVTYYLSQNLHDLLRSGKVTVEEDNFKVMQALARSFELQGKEDLAKALDALLEEHSSEVSTPAVLAS